MLTTQAARARQHKYYCVVPLFLEDLNVFKIRPDRIVVYRSCSASIVEYFLKIQEFYVTSPDIASV